MAQPISPMIWNKAAITDNRLLPGRYSVGIFTGKGVNIANNQEAYAYDDILVSDRIFDYDDRRLNGLQVPANLADSSGPDGWGASAYGPFQTVRFTRRVFTSGQHKSIAWRVFDEKQYAGAMTDANGGFGTAAVSTAYTGGEAYLSTAETINKAKKIWDAEILGPHIDRYNFFAVANGHISGRFVQTNAGTGQLFDGIGTWIASPGPYEGLSYPPEFAPIKAIEWDSLNVRPMLNAIDVAWTNLFIPEDNRVILLDKSYKDDLLSNLIGIPGTMPMGDKAYDALVEGRFERLYGWDFDFSIPSQYYPKVYVDENNNVVHTAAGTAAYDAVINSIDGGDGKNWLTTELSASSRMRATNYIGTVYDANTHAFKNIVTNYPANGPGATGGVFGTAVSADAPSFAVGTLAQFPWMGWPGQGLASPTGPMGAITQKQVIGMAVYRPAAQLGQEYGAMETDRGKTRGKFTELVFDLKHDAWVIPQFSHGILLIVDSTPNVGTPALKVDFVNDEVLAVNFTTPPTTLDTSDNGTVQLVWDMDGAGNFNRNVQFASSDTAIATVNSTGLVTTAGVTGTGPVTITITAVGDTSLTDTVVITVVA
jgi:hypothetical protein